MRILVNDVPIRLTADDLPMLVSGTQGMGSSLFTIHLVLNFFRDGEKLLFFSALPAAKEDFRQLLSKEELLETEFVRSADALSGKRAIVLLGGEASLLQDAIKRIDDVSDRIVLLKNMDAYGPDLFESTKNLKRIVISGDIDKTSYHDALSSREFATKIFFSRPTKSPLEFIEPLRYEGVIYNANHHGTIRLGT